MVNLGGRPREYDRDKVAQDLIEWAKKDDSINVNKFCAYYDPPFPVTNLSDWAKEDDGFRRSYNTAKSFIAFRREEWLSKQLLHQKAYDLTAPAYDGIVRESKQFESSLRKDEEGSKQSTYNIMVPNDLAIGSNIPTQTIPITNNKGSK
jgi:hypothetical protein